MQKKKKKLILNVIVLQLHYSTETDNNSAINNNIKQHRQTRIESISHYTLYIIFWQEGNILLGPTMTTIVAEIQQTGKCNVMK